MQDNIPQNAKLYIAPEDFKIDFSSSKRLGNSFLGFNSFNLFFRNQGLTYEFNLSYRELFDWSKKNNRKQEVEEKIHLICANRSNLHGLSFEKPKVMGVLNVTPDSFSDGGKFVSYDDAVNHGEIMAEDGANILDIGGESSRPGATPVSYEEEYSRVIPVVRHLAKNFLISVDTNKSQMMVDSVEAGASLINDISSLTNNEDSIDKIRSSSCGVILMHSQGSPKNMQVNPVYNDCLLDVYDYLENRIRFCEKSGIERNRIIIDPGIGFGKNDQHMRRIIKNISLFHSLGCPLLLGFSRKSFISRWSKLEKEKDRLGGSIASMLWSLSRGVQIFRVHDVSQTLQAIKIWMHIAETES